MPRNSDKYSEIAKNKWSVEFQFYDVNSDKMVRLRLSKQLYRIKEYHEKLDAFTQLQLSCTEALKQGWNPLKTKEEVPIEQKETNLTLELAKDLFVDYHKGKGTRPKKMGRLQLQSRRMQRMRYHIVL